LAFNAEAAFARLLFSGLPSRGRHHRNGGSSFFAVWRVPRQGAAMRISARNQIKGTIVEVTKGATTSHVRVDIGGGQIVTASITNAAVDELGLKVGGKAVVVIKASDVMIGVE
jgi:molybdopterin-binding protein